MKTKLLVLVLIFLPMLMLGQKVAELNDRSIVKDSVGNVYPFSVWYNLMFTGYYSIQAENPKDRKSAFILSRLTEEQREEQLKSYGKPRESNSFKEGKPIRNFKAEDLNGNKFELEALRGKIVVINFWFIKCGPCQREIPELNKLVEDYKDSSNVVFLAIALDDKHDLNEFLNRVPFNYNIIYNGRAFAQQYNITGYPTHVILDQNGKVYFHTLGLAMNTVYWLGKSIRELMGKSL